jgi:alpha-aminoadipate/glutamate carrier protein LysW
MGKNESTGRFLGAYCKISEKSKPVVYVRAKCPDCDANLDIPTDTQSGEIYNCPGCGLELEVKGISDGTADIKELTLEGEDWGE